jgi:glutamine synthetase
VELEQLRSEKIDFLPSDLSQALDALEKDEVILSALGSRYAPYYLNSKREEWKRYLNSISQWEIDNYLGLY